MERVRKFVRTLSLGASLYINENMSQSRNLSERARAGHRFALPYLLSLVLPLLTSGFFVAPVGRRWAAVGWLLSLGGMALGDEFLSPVRRPRAADGPSFARVADVVAALQIANFGLFVWRVAAWGVSVDTAIAVVMVGIGSAFSSMIAAHEIVHRTASVSRFVGRALLWTVLYDQFFVDHLRGHHRTVGTASDVLTARRDETFTRYLARSWPGELRSAWRIEIRRTSARSRIGALVTNDVVRGMVAEAALLALIVASVGPLAVPCVLAQAALAHLLVAAVNFFEHWGIVRGDRRVGAGDAWDSAAPLSHYALLGLSFHSDHHVRASRSFDRLELSDASPRLPHGYFTMAAMVIFRSARVRQILAIELSRSGTFAFTAAPEAGG
jgi:alkane 1-monooxygenase